MAPPGPYCLVLSTCPDPDSAKAIAHTLVEGKLAACVNIVPGLRSIYTWQGKVESADEQLLLIKTRADHYSRVEAAIHKHHPYELPEVVSVPIETGSPDYLAWIDATLNKP